MKAKLLITTLITALSNPAWAMSTCIATVPTDCQIQGSHFEIYEVDTAFSLQVNCLFSDGNYVSYIAEKPARFLWVLSARAYKPYKIAFQKTDQDRVTLSCN